MKLKKAPLKKIREDLGERMDEDWKAASALIQAIRMTEHHIFGNETKVNVILHKNGRGIEANYYPDEMEYDIYLPGLGERFSNTQVLFPQKFYLRDNLKKAFFVGAHKIRHRLQSQSSVRIITPNYRGNNLFIKSIIEKVKDTKKHDLCSCSVLGEQDQTRMQLLEFDALIVQHLIVSRFWLLNGAEEFSEVPGVFLKAISQDISIDS